MTWIQIWKNWEEKTNCKLILTHIYARERSESTDVDNRLKVCFCRARKAWTPDSQKNMHCTRQSCSDSLKNCILAHDLLWLAEEMHSFICNCIIMREAIGIICLAESLLEKRLWLKNVHEKRLWLKNVHEKRLWLKNVHEKRLWLKNVHSLRRCRRHPLKFI